MRGSPGPGSPRRRPAWPCRRCGRLHIASIVAHIHAALAARPAGAPPPAAAPDAAWRAAWCRRDHHRARGQAQPSTSGAGIACALLVTMPQGRPRASSRSAPAAWPRRPGSRAAGAARTAPGIRPKRIEAIVSGPPRTPRPACRVRPLPTIGRSWASGTAAGRAARMSLAAPARSGALSTSVPSRSNSTGDRAGTVGSAHGRPAGQQVVHAGVVAQAVALGQGVVAHALGGRRSSPRHGTSGQFAGADEARVLVRALGQQLEQVLGADDGEQEGLGVAVDGGEEHPAARA
jgi:hypothetical protein